PGLQDRNDRPSAATSTPPAETTGLHQRRGPRGERLSGLARARPVRQGDRHGGARSDPNSPGQPAQDWRKDGDPGRPAPRAAASHGREGPERQDRNEGNYAGIVLDARGIRRICFPGILIKSPTRLAGYDPRHNIASKCLALLPPTRRGPRPITPRRGGEAMTWSPAGRL